MRRASQSAKPRQLNIMKWSSSYVVTEQECPAAAFANRTARKTATCPRCFVIAVSSAIAVWCDLVGQRDNRRSDLSPADCARSFGKWAPVSHVARILWLKTNREIVLCEIFRLKFYRSVRIFHEHTNRRNNFWFITQDTTVETGHKSQ